MNTRSHIVDSQDAPLVKQFLNLSLGLSLCVGGIPLALYLLTSGVAGHNFRLLFLSLRLLSPIFIFGFLFGITVSVIRRLELTKGFTRLIRILRDSECVERWSVQHGEPDFPWRFPWGGLPYSYEFRRLTRFLDWLVFRSFTVGSQVAILLILVVSGGLYGSFFLRLESSPIFVYIGLTGLGIGDLLSWLLWGRHSVRVKQLMG